MFENLNLEKGNLVTFDYLYDDGEQGTVSGEFERVFYDTGDWSLVVYVPRVHMSKAFRTENISNLHKYPTTKEKPVKKDYGISCEWEEPAGKKNEALFLGISRGVDLKSACVKLAVIDGGFGSAFDEATMTYWGRKIVGKELGFKVQLDNHFFTHRRPAKRSEAEWKENTQSGAKDLELRDKVLERSILGRVWELTLRTLARTSQT